MDPHRNDGASAPGLAAPERATNDDAGLQPGITGKHEIECPDCAPLDADRKVVVTMMAHAAEAGCTLHQLAGGGYLLCRWGMAKELPCLRAVGDLLRRVWGAR